MSGSEDGSRCVEMEPMLSAFCDGETTPEQAATLRERLRACAHCRSVLRSYRTAPRAAAALLPGLPFAGSLLHRAREAFGRLLGRLPGHRGPANSGIGQLAAGGAAPGTGLTVLTKVVAVCAGAAGTGAVCMAVGLAPAPQDLVAHPDKAPAIVRQSVDSAPPERSPHSARTRRPQPRPPAPKPAGHQVEEPAAEAPPPAPEEAAIEYEPPPAETTPAPVETAPAPAPSEPPQPSSGSAAGEFGP